MYKRQIFGRIKNDVKSNPLLECTAHISPVILSLSYKMVVKLSVSELFKLEWPTNQPSELMPSEVKELAEVQAHFDEENLVVEELVSVEEKNGEYIQCVSL